MATFSVIKESEAPKRTTYPNSIKKRMAQYESYLSQVAKGQVGKLEPTQAETPRALSMRISRAGARSGRAVRTWIADGTVYFTVG